MIILTDADSWLSVWRIVKSAFEDVVLHLVAETRPLVTDALRARQRERRISERCSSPYTRGCL